MKKRLAFVVLFLFSSLWAADLAVVVPGNATRLEKAAADELASHLGQILGQTVPVTSESTATRRILLNNAAPLPPREFAAEEWEQIALSANELAIRGGYPHGLLYGIYDFLENHLGVIWMDEWSTHIPKAKQVSWPADFRRSGQPSFRYRGLYTYRGPDRELRRLFLLRNRQNHFHDERYNSGVAWDLGVLPAVGAPRACHTFFNYTEKWGDDMEDCFSWSASAKKRIRAINASGPGQICYTNPRTRQAFKKQLREYIEGDRKFYKGEYLPTIYVLAANDNGAHCQCDSCAEFSRKHNLSGLFLDFLNDIAADIESDYSDISLMSLFWMNLKEPPVGVLPRRNVRVELAYLGGEYNGEHRDTLRPYLHPSNRESLESIQGWQRLGTPLGIWDYWCLNADRGRFPAANELNIVESLRFYHQNHFDFVFAECRDAEFASFLPLRLWLGLRMANDLSLDARREIRRFIAAYFGPAASPMQLYHDFLEQTTAAVNGSLCDLPLTRRTDLDDTFFTKVFAWLDEAEKLAADSPEILKRIERERISVDYARLARRAQLAPISLEERKAIAARLQANHSYAIRKFEPENRVKSHEDDMALFVQGIIADVPPLHGFEQRDVLGDYTWPALARHRNHSVFDDPQAAGGKAVGMIGKEGRYPEKREQLVENRGIRCGIYNYSDRKNLLKSELPPEALPLDEQYHWYYLGRATLSAKCFLWMHWTWLSQLQLNELYDTSGLNNLVDVFVSLKVAGPRYVKNSTASDCYAIDRVVVCRAANLQAPGGLPLPKQYATRTAALDLWGTALPLAYKAKKTADAQAAGGSALRLADESDHEGRPFQIGMYDEINHKPVLKIVPARVEEGYQFYSLGVHAIPANGYIYAHSSGLLRVPLPIVFSNADPMRKYEIILSVKASGPAYHPGSTEENAVFIDRLLLLDP